MSVSADSSEARAARERFVGLLRTAEARSTPLRFWWRDDDAVTATPQLERLLAMAERHAVPLALAVIPAGTTAELAERLSHAPRLSVLQHGWDHANHSPPGEKKMELGDHRPLPIILSQLRAGFERLTGLFGERLLPILVPPWNRIAKSVLDELPRLGFAGASLYGPAHPDNPYCVNAHLDIFDWHPARVPKSRAAAYEMLSDEVERRLNGSAEPIGILSHHLVHEDETWALLDELFDLLGGCSAADWPDIPALFGLNRP